MKMVMTAAEKKRDRMVETQKLLNAGLESKAIAEKLNCSVRCIENYRKELKLTFDPNSTLELLAEVREESLNEIREVIGYMKKKMYATTKDGCVFQFGREIINGHRAIREFFPDQVHEFEEDNTLTFADNEEPKEKCPHCFHRHDNHEECPEKRNEVIEE